MLHRARVVGLQDGVWVWQACAALWATLPLNNSGLLIRTTLGNTLALGMTTRVPELKLGGHLLEQRSTRHKKPILLQTNLSSLVFVLLEPGIRKTHASLRVLSRATMKQSRNA